MMRLLIIVLLSLVCQAGCINNRPIVGILSQPYSGKLKDKYSQAIAASYVKFVEAAGARVIAIPYTADDHVLRFLTSRINGILFPGGEISLVPTLDNTYYQTSRKLLQLAIESKPPLPVWGTCLGWEALAIIAANSNYTVLTASGSYDAYHYSLPIKFTPEAKNSRLFKHVPNSLKMALETRNITYNHHSYGVAPRIFAGNKPLSNFFKVLATGQDRDGDLFIAAAEAYHYPIYGVQFHPEKLAFEWRPSSEIDHSREAIMSTQYYANFFVDECRQNDRHFTDLQMESSLLIENKYYLYNGCNSSFMTEYLMNDDTVDWS